MSGLLLAAAVGAAGSGGAVCRFLLDSAIRRRTAPGLPWATVMVNVLGSFTLGLLVALQHDGRVSLSAATVLGGGFCGGFTTFSTAIWEALALRQERGGGSPRSTRGDGRGALVGAWLVATLGACLLAAAGGCAAGALARP